MLKLNSRAYKGIIWLLAIFVIIVIAHASDIYIVGGDDTRIYYLYPEKFIKNFSLNIVTSNSLSNLNSYTSQAHLLPFLILLSVLKYLLPSMNLQIFMYSSNVLFAIVFFYKLVGLFTDISDLRSKLATLFSAFLYVFSIFIFYSLFRHQLLAIYLLSIFPISLYLFVLGLKKRNIIYPISAATVLSLSGLLFVSIPWISAIVIANIPLFLYLLIKYKKIFVFHFIVFSVVLLGLNFYWVFHLFNSILINSGSIGSSQYLSAGFRQSNIWGIRFLSSINRLIYPLDFLYQYDIQANFKWNLFDIYTRWYLRLLPINIFLTLLIFIGSIFRKRRNNFVFAFALLSLLLTTFLFTANIGAFGTELFVILNKYVPGFVMFRNMYDKFAFPFSFVFSFSLAIALIKILNSTKHNLVSTLLVFGYCVLVTFNILPAVKGDYFNLNVWSTKQSKDQIQDLNQDYLEMANFIKSQEGPDKYLMVPLASGNNFIIQGEHDPNGYYVGVSPLVIFTEKEDFSGSISFSHFDDEVMSAILEGRYEDAYYYFKFLNIKYLVLNKALDADIQQSRFYGQALYDAQMNTNFIDGIVGEKIADFGHRYSLYEISNEYFSEKIFMSDEIHSFGSREYQTIVKKVNNEEFAFIIQDSSKGKYLNFLETYNSGWDLYTVDGRKIKTENQFGVFDYANAWEINDYEPFKVEDDKYEIRVKFTPATYTKYAYFISLLTLMSLIIYVFKKQHDK